MTILKTLKFKAFETVSKNNPIAVRRRKLIAKIDEQILLATDSSFVPVKTKWLKDSEGVEQKTEVRKRVKRWWSECSDGTVQLTVRYGSKPIEFEKGKSAILVATLAEVAPTLKTVRTAVESGELDELLEAQFAFRKRVSKPNAT